MIALAMWRIAFGGADDFGLGSAIAVFLFLLVIPSWRSTSAASGGRHDDHRHRQHSADPARARHRGRPRSVRALTARSGQRRADPDRPALAGADVRPAPTSLIAPDGRSAAAAGGRSSPTRASLTFDNYQAIFDNDAITDSLFTTVSIAVGGTVLPVFVAALAGYAFAWLEFPGRDWLFIVVDRRCSSCRCRWR